MGKLVKPSIALSKRIKESLTNEDVSLMITFLNVQKHLNSILCSLGRNASKRRFHRAFPKSPTKNTRTIRLASSISAMVLNNRKSVVSHVAKIKWSTPMTIKRRMMNIVA